MSLVKNPLVQLALAGVILLSLAALTVAAGISGDITGMAITALGFGGVVALLWILKQVK